jgi:tetratricopeptide (TPR) repeat protein
VRGDGRGRPVRPRVRPVSPEEQERQSNERKARAQGWGGVARKGAVHISADRGEMETKRREEPIGGALPVDRGEWVRTDAPVRKSAAGAGKPKPPYQLPTEIAAEVRRVFEGTVYQRERLVALLTRAAEAYDRHRWEEAVRHARPVAEGVPSVPAVRELIGLAAYRAERFPMAKIHLDAHFQLTGDPEHVPQIMDCERAGRRYRLIPKLFEAMRVAEATPDTMAEGLIVYAGALADQRKFAEAVQLLLDNGVARNLRNPGYRHVRLWYALADVYDRAGDVASARAMFQRVVAAEPDAYDAADRLTEIGIDAPRKNRKRKATPVSKKKNVD